MNILPKIDANFPFKTLNHIIREPTYESINNITLKLYYNASSIPSTLRGGKHVHLGMVMKPNYTNESLNIPSNTLMTLDQVLLIQKIMKE